MEKVDTSAAKMEATLKLLAEVIEEGAGPLATDCERLINALAAERDALSKERDIAWSAANQMTAKRDAAQSALRAREAEVGRLREALEEAVTGFRTLAAQNSGNPLSTTRADAMAAFAAACLHNAKAALATPAPEDAA